MGLVEVMENISLNTILLGIFKILKEETVIFVSDNLNRLTSFQIFFHSIIKPL
jgi:hypothetical protein